MSYIVRTISGDDNKELNKINEILNKMAESEDKSRVEEFISMLEEKGYVICKKVNIDN